MTRPTKALVSSGNQGWDASVDDNDAILFNGPLPIHEHTGDQTDLASTFAAAAFDRCFVMVNHTTLGWSLYVSDGTTWNRIWSTTSIVAVVDLTNDSGGTGDDTLQALTDPADAPATADALRDDLVLNLIPELRNNYTDLSDKVTELIDALKDHGLIT